MDNFIKSNIFTLNEIRNHPEYLPMILDKTKPKRAKRKICNVIIVTGKDAPLSLGKLGTNKNGVKVFQNRKSDEAWFALCF